MRGESICNYDLKFMSNKIYIFIYMNNKIICFLKYE